MIRLGVNIDHVATLRQARGEEYPSVVLAAEECLREGADQITIHLREDRRHIQDHDVKAVKAITKKMGRPLNLEMGCAGDILEIALRERPEWICLVPEKREEKTTEGGLDLLSSEQWTKIKRTCEEIKRGGGGQIRISLFLEAKEEILERAAGLPIDAVEIHTGEYARSFLLGQDLTNHYGRFNKASTFLREKKLGRHAGHGLTRESVLPLLQKGFFEEYNIGHWIIAEAVFVGLPEVVRQLKGLFHAHR